MTRTTTTRYDADEARKELLATLHASRELGPEMDETLADRFMERLAALRPAGSYDQTKTRADLLALLSSSQGSDPAGDDALVESFLTGIQAPAPAVPMYAPYPPPYAPYPPQYGPPARATPNSLAGMTPMLLLAAIFVVSLVVTQGHSVWMIWMLPLVFGWGRRNRYQRRMYRDSRRDYRDARRDYRNNRILNRDETYGPLPPSGPPEIL